MPKPLWADDPLAALLSFRTTATHKTYGPYGYVGGSRMNQRTHDAIVVAAYVSGWGPVTFTQGGLNNGAVAASAKTHNGLDVADISVTGHPIAAQKVLVAQLMLCGAIGFIRGTTADNINDGMVAHIHTVLVGAQHAHPDAKAQLYNTRYGYAYGGAGLGGAPSVRWWGPPRQPLIEWADSTFNPENGWRP